MVLVRPVLRTLTLAAVVLGLASQGVLGTGAGSARAAEAPADSSSVRCVVTDPRLAQLSGLSARRGALYAISDQGPTVYELDDLCRVVRESAIPQAVQDVEDLAQTVDGLLWLGDIGGNRVPRSEVAVIRFNPESGNVVRYALAYPDGTHDAEALLVTPSAQVFIVTKSETGVSGVYTAPSPLLSDGVNQMQQVAELRLRDIPGRTVGNGSVLVTGGAVSYDGTHVVLRTYKNAYEWAVPDTDVGAALATRAPTVIGLPEEKQGEAVTYDEGGLQLLVSGEQLPSPVHAVALPRQPVETAATATSGVSRTPQLLGVVFAAALALLVVLRQLLGIARSRTERASSQNKGHAQQA